MRFGLIAEQMDKAGDVEKVRIALHRAINAYPLDHADRNALAKLYQLVTGGLPHLDCEGTIVLDGSPPLRCSRPPDHSGQPHYNHETGITWLDDS